MGSTRSAALLGLIFFALATVFRVFVVDPYAATRHEASLDQDGLVSPGPAVLQVASMEHAPAVADLWWLQIVQDLGQLYPASADHVERWSWIAVDLDPRYYAVYYASAIHLLVYAKRADAAAKLLRRGWEALPDRWELPFLLGYERYFMQGDSAEASKLWEEASRLPGAARFLPSLAARARFQSGDESGSIAMLESMLDALEGPALDDALIRLKMLKTEPRLRAYDDACLRFRTEKGRLPTSGEELLKQGYTTEPAFDLLGKPITLDVDCRARTEYITVREDEARKRAGSQGKEDAPGPNVEVSGPSDVEIKP